MAKALKVGRVQTDERNGPCPSCPVYAVQILIWDYTCQTSVAELPGSWTNARNGRRIGRRHPLQNHNAAVSKLRQRLHVPGCRLERRCTETALTPVAPSVLARRNLLLLRFDAAEAWHPRRLCGRPCECGWLLAHSSADVWLNQGVPESEGQLPSRHLSPQQQASMLSPRMGIIDCTKRLAQGRFVQ